MTSAAGGHTWEDAVRSLVGDPTQRELVEACYFDLPLAGAARRYAESPEWAAMRRVIGTPGGVALDIGAGNGIVSYALAQDGWTAVAVEPDPSALVGAGAIRALATETGVTIDVRHGFGERLPVADGEAQLVIARQVLHHARDLPAFAREIGRVLAPGGQLISTRDHVISGPEQLQAFLDSHPLHRHYGGENAFTRAQYIAALKGAGLSIQREIGALESVINYAPFTPQTLAAEIGRRLGPLGGPARVALSSPLLLGPLLRLISSIDRRPGRLVSFICTKRSD
ncbi:MAG: class I SAM-dependent methyltransferase [Devosia sp.]|nr:class I SAM-dependent methyltransferase [Devosia sp.]